MSYNRYTEFKLDDSIRTVPFIKLPQKSTDKEEQYVIGKTRLDLLSYKYYKDANFGWLILLANPSVGSLEFNIRDGEILTIPFPLETSLKDYINEVNKYKKYYGI